MKADQVKRLRGSLGYTQRQLADELGVASNTVARWERGDSPVSEPYSKLLADMSKKQLASGSIRPAPGMPRDDHHRKILQRLNEHLDPDKFEDCAVDLLSGEFPGLAPVSGGQDDGYDGALPDVDGPPAPLITTTSEKYVQNLRKNLRSALGRHADIQAAIFATSRRVTPKGRKALYEACTEKGVKLINVYDQEWFAQRLYHTSSWSKSLLGLGGRPCALSVFPASRRPVIGDKVIGRQQELQQLQDANGDSLVLGEPGSGKTFLARSLAMRGATYFVVDWDREQLSNSIRDKAPDSIIVDDAQHRVDKLTELQQLREQLDEPFRIIALSWPNAASLLSQCMGISSSQVVRLEKLDRNTMVHILKSLRIKHPELIRLIVNQASGRPGLAATMAHLCLQGDIRKVATGEALADLLSEFISRPAARLLAILSLDGKRGVPLEIPKSLLGISIHEIHSILEEIEPAGVITQAGETFIVIPDELRFVLVRDHFLDNAGMGSELKAAAEMIPNVSELTLTLIGARSRGARIIDLLDRVRALNSESLWAAYSQLGPSESREAVLQFDSLPSSIARSSIEHIPDLVIPQLLDDAKSDRRSTHNNTDHPLRIITGWCVDVSPFTVDVVMRRQQAIASIVRWVENCKDVNTGLRAISRIFTPGFEAYHSDPGRGDRITITRGILATQDILRLEKSWEAIELLPFEPEELPWPDVFSMLHNWSVFMSVKPSDEQRNECDRIFRRLIDFFAKQAMNKPGVQLRLADLSETGGYDLVLQRSRDFYTCYPPGSARGYLENDSEYTEAAKQLGQKWMSKYDLRGIAKKVSEIEHEASAAGLSYPRYTLVACQEVCNQLEDRVAFCLALMEEGVPPDVVNVCTRGSKKLDGAGQLELATKCLQTKVYEGVGISLALAMEELPNDVAEEVVDRSSRWLRLIEFGSGWGDISHNMCSRLLDSPDEKVRLYAAVGILRPDKDVKFRSELLAKAKDVVVEAAREDMRDPTIEYRVGELLTSDASMSMRWIRRQIAYFANSMMFADDRLVSKALLCLSTNQKKELISELTSGQVSRVLASGIVNDNLAHFSALLKSNAPADVRLAPLSNVDDRTWRDMTAKALDEGLSEEEVAGASLPDHYSWGGSESAMWQSHLARFEPFSDDENAGVRRVVKELSGWLQERIEDARSRERNEDIYGR